MSSSQANPKKQGNTVNKPVNTKPNSNMIPPATTPQPPQQPAQPDFPYPCLCRRQQGFKEGWCGVAGGGVPACDH